MVGQALQQHLPRCQEVLLQHQCFLCVWPLDLSDAYGPAGRAQAVPPRWWRSRMLPHWKARLRSCELK